MNAPEIVITHEDFQRLCGLLADAPASRQRALERLDAEVARARLVSASAVGSDVVTMNTRLIVEELTSNARRVVTIVYPEEANAEEGRVSIDSPLGSALIGLRTGQTIEWSVSGRPPARYRVGAILHQPQAAAARAGELR